MRCLLLLPLLAGAQDTLHVVAYNILRYGATPGYCDTRCKDQQLRTIFSYLQPDLIGINEIGPSAALVRRLLDSVLNINGVDYWRSSLYQNTVNSDIVSALFYDSRRLGWLGQTLITTQGGLRDVFAYHLYYKEPNLAQTQDTLFLVAIVSHLKAGNGTSDAQTRAQAATAIRQYIQNLPPDRRRFVLEMGDHNLYSSSETAYQELTQVLVDPGPAGSWSNNSAFAFYHTQSTRSTSLADGGSGGGMDDRFDFILFSPECTTSTARARYVPGSFRAVGQDGQRFKQSINAAPLPSGYPTSVINALYVTSDHLPVSARFALSVQPATGLSTAPEKTPPLRWWIEGSTLCLQANEPLTMRIGDLVGRIWVYETLSAGENRTYSLPAGVYFLQVSSLPTSTSLISILP